MIRTSATATVRRTTSLVVRALISRSTADDVRAVHEATQRCRHDHRAICLLIVLENGNPRSSHGETGTIERVHEVGLAGSLRPVFDVRASRLECLAVGTGRNLAIRV